MTMPITVPKDSHGRINSRTFATEALGSGVEAAVGRAVATSAVAAGAGVGSTSTLGVGPVSPDAGAAVPVFVQAASSDIVARPHISRRFIELPQRWWASPVPEGSRSIV